MVAKEANLLDIILNLLKHKATIIKIVGVLTIFSLIVSLVWPKTYKSTSEVIQIRESGGGIAGGLLQNLTSFNITGSKVGGETILIVLNSQTLRKDLIREFNLTEVYGSEIMEELLLRLDQNLVIEEVREGGFGFNPIVSVKISVIDDEPERARDMNQFILEVLSKRLEVLNRNSISKTLEVLQSRFHQNLSDLENAELKLNEFQNRYGIIQLPKQIEVQIENLATLKAEMIRKQIELSVIARNMDQGSSAYRAKLIEFNEIEQAFQSLIDESEDISEVEDSFFSLQDMPDLLLLFVRLQREVEIQQSIQETLFPQLEQYKIMMENSGSGIQIVDEPNLPTYKHSPKRLYIVLAGFFFSIILSLIIVFIRVGKRDPESETSKKIGEIKRELSFKK